MATGGENLLDRLRLDDQKLDDSQQAFFEELQRVLSAETIEAGVWLRFGEDREALKTTIESLGLDRMVAAGGPVRIIQLIVKEIGITSFLGKSIDAVSQLPLVDGLDVLQIERWETEPGYLSLRDVKMPRHPVTSKILLAKASLGEDGLVSDPNHPGILLSATYSSVPELTEEDGDEIGLFSQISSISEFIDGQNNRDGIVGAFATHMANNAIRLRMPRHFYSMGIGPLANRENIFGNNDSVSTRRELELVHGRFNQLS